MIHPERLRVLRNNIPYLFQPGSILNIGANRIRFELLSELVAAKKEIDLLEIFPANAEHWRNDSQRRLRRVIEGDVREIDKLGLEMYDTVLWWHGPEHIDQHYLAPTLAKLEQLAQGLIVLGCPWGKYPQGTFMDNPHETHRNSIYPADLTRLGYRVATLGQADQQGSLFAWKYMRPRDPGPRIPQVVMVTHGDREEYLRQTIPAVLATNWPLTLTVVANAPGAAARRCLNALKPQLYKLITYKKNNGKPRAANRGWRLRPEAEYTVLLDDDALAVEPDWLRKLVDIIDKCPQVGIVGHSMEVTNWPLKVLTGPDESRRTVQVQPGNLGGACILVPRRTVELCGRYNEELPAYGESDGLYGWKVKQAGLLCAYFDHTNLGRSFRHLGHHREPDYQDWQQKTRQQAQEIAARLREEYLAGRPLNQ